MTAIDPGEIRIVVGVDDGAVRSVRIENRRPVSLASAFAGRTAAEVEAATGLLHGLCGRSHAAGIRFAAAAASGAVIGEDERSGWMLRLAAERLGEHLRGVAGGEPALVRGAVAAATAAARTGTVTPAAAAAVAEAVERLALGDQPRSTDAGGPRPDPLTAADDDAVVARLAAAGDFARAPSLPGRRIETGPAARRGSSAADPAMARAARIAEIIEAADLVARAARGETLPTEGWVRSGVSTGGAGFAAVETPRGTLHTLVTVQGEGRLSSVRVLAPTEWNFHPAGPLAACLSAMRPEGDASGAIRSRAAAFDPCVRFSAVVEGTRHA